MPDATRLLIATRKGAWFLDAAAGRADWRLTGPLFLGQIIHHLVADPRDPKVLMAATSTGHLGPRIQRSGDGGATWLEANRPPGLPNADPHGRSVDHTVLVEARAASEA